MRFRHAIDRGLLVASSEYRGGMLHNWMPQSSAMPLSASVTARVGSILARRINGRREVDGVSRGLCASGLQRLPAELVRASVARRVSNVYVHAWTTIKE